MEIWFDGSTDGCRSAWAALLMEIGRKPRLIYGTAQNIPCGDVDRWAARQVLARMKNRCPGNLMLVSDREDNSSHPVNGDPRLIWTWRSRRHPVIRYLDRVANALRRDIPVPAMI
jgi:hypothetical protein